MLKPYDVTLERLPSPLFKFLRVVRLIFPRAVRARARDLLFQWLSLTWDLSFGLRARVCNWGDWIIYNEIFVRGEYDRALSIALDSTDGSAIHIVDIGGNVGFFTLRAVQRLRERRGASCEFTITAVEANARCAGEFQARILGENELSPHVTLVHGLVGERTGAGDFYENSIFSGLNGNGGRGVRVPYVDLSSLLQSLPRIDLLKCDIEGAELLLIENYPDLLQKVRVAVFEFHDDLCDTARCKALLREYGFTHHETFRPGRPYSIYGAWR